MKDAIVEQQIKISKLERQGLNSLPDLSTPTTPSEATAARELHSIEDPITTGITARTRKPKKQAEMKARKEKELAEQEARERVKREAKERAEQEAKERAEWEAKEQAEKAAREEAGRDVSKRAKVQEARGVQQGANENEGAEKKDLSPVPQPATGYNAPSSPKEGNSKPTLTPWPGKSRQAPPNPTINSGMWFKTLTDGF